MRCQHINKHLKFWKTSKKHMFFKIFLPEFFPEIWLESWSISYNFLTVFTPILRNIRTQQMAVLRSFLMDSAHAGDIQYFRRFAVFLSKAKFSNLKISKFSSTNFFKLKVIVDIHQKYAFTVVAVQHLKILKSTSNQWKSSRVFIKICQPISSPDSA